MEIATDPRGHPVRCESLASDIFLIITGLYITTARFNKRLIGKKREKESESENENERDRESYSLYNLFLP